MRVCILAMLLLYFSVALFSQKPDQPDAAEIYHQLQKLNTLGKVLYLAAHPDDENTRFISYCANEKNYQTAYLSLTRGDGGQNLIGPELREELGIMRTQELLAARRIDGGIQYFSRANDFGYSKTAKETLEIWDKEKILGDVVRVIRMFRPDIIVCRFPDNNYGGHGHHIAS
ncbi:MAG TPA: PIG-L family deacetylase, partial [Saprospiraceae bacterium]|nr:PIG-L family deacetylase [Saprospiraceae bacterium]